MDCPNKVCFICALFFCLDVLSLHLCVPYCVYKWVWGTVCCNEGFQWCSIARAWVWVCRSELERAVGCRSIFFSHSLPPFPLFILVLFFFFSIFDYVSLLRRRGEVGGGGGDDVCWICVKGRGQCRYTFVQGRMQPPAKMGVQFVRNYLEANQPSELVWGGGGVNSG